MRPEKPRADDKFFVRKNEQIRVPKILLVKDGQRVGIFSPLDALAMAREEGLDLVEVSAQARPPVCAIMDYGKYRYEQQKRQKERQKNSGPKEKEVNFRYVIDDHDLETKAGQIRKFLEHGDKVKITVKFKARENAHKEQGMVVIKRCLTLLGDLAHIEKHPALEGNTILARVSPKVS